ncbi:MAG TPA: DUF6282 family protein [Egibacteraceae bacterium]|nr:DUF6282 family protein [Egibacteraceae bacterium]
MCAGPEVAVDPPDEPATGLRTSSPYGGPLLDMANAIDLHCHPYPDLFPRAGDDLSIALAARDSGMRAVVLKCHHESTVSRAYHVQRQVPEIDVFGGIVLNSYVGYINPAAVEAALKMGGKVIWMPTIDAGYHAQMHGGTGGYEAQSGGRARSEGVWVLDERGDFKPEVREVFELVAEHDAILGTCHLSPREIVAIVKETAERGIQKVTVTHPFFKVPNLDMGTVEEVARLGAYLEFGYCTISPAWHYAIPEKVVEAVQRVGASRCLLVSDTGQRHNPLPHEALRVFGQTVFEKGLSGADIETMIIRNPLGLLGIPEKRLTTEPPLPTGPSPEYC